MTRSEERVGCVARWYPLRVVAAAAVALAMTAPSATPAVSAFVDPLIDGLDVSRLAISTAWLIGTLVGAAALPAIGRCIDNYGTQRVMMVIGLAFGAVLIGLSSVTGIIGLTIGFAGIRLLGQGSLALTATTTVAIYIRHRRGFAQGIATAVGAAGVALAPVILERAVSEHGFRTVWVVEGLVVWAVVVPLAWGILPPKPAALAETEDTSPESGSGLPPVDWTRRQAMHTGIFWVVASGVTTMSTLGTALIFHQIALLGERGLTPSEAAATFLPLMIAGLAATLLVGYLADRVSDRVLIISALASLIVALLSAAFASSGLSALGYGAALGVTISGIQTVEATTFTHCFGLGHLGAIRGVVHTLAVIGSAIGPLLMSVGQAAAGGYRPVVLVATVIPLMAICFATIVKRPPPHPDQLRRRLLSDSAGGSRCAPNRCRNMLSDRKSTGQRAHDGSL
jgi:MFS family permease